MELSPATAGTNSSEGQQFSEFPALVAKTTHGVLWFLPLGCVSILDPPRVELAWAENRYKPSECSRRDGARRPHRATSGASCTAQLLQPGEGTDLPSRGQLARQSSVMLRFSRPNPRVLVLRRPPCCPVRRVRGAKILGILVRVSRDCNPGLAPERGTRIGARHEKMALLCAQPSASEVSLLEPPKVPDPSENAAAEISSALVADVRALVNAAHAIALPRPSMLSWYFSTGASETGFAGISSARSAPGTANRCLYAVETIDFRLRSRFQPAEPVPHDPVCRRLAGPVPSQNLIRTAREVK
jgi:hypothetical protein